MATNDAADILKMGTRVNIRGTGLRNGKIVEYRGPRALGRMHLPSAHPQQTESGLCRVSGRSTGDHSGRRLTRK